MRRSSRSFPSITCVAACVSGIALLLAHAAVAAPTDPVTVTTPPTDEGAAFVPGVRGLEPLPADYVEEEYFVSGAATVYTCNCTEEYVRINY